MHIASSVRAEEVARREEGRADRQAGKLSKQVDRKGSRATQYPGRAERVIREDCSRRPIRLSPAPARLPSVARSYPFRFHLALTNCITLHTVGYGFVRSLFVSRYASLSCGKVVEREFRRHAGTLLRSQLPPTYLRSTKHEHV